MKLSKSYLNRPRRPLAGKASPSVPVVLKRAAVKSAIDPVAVQLGVARAHAPQAGDYWPRCAAARPAGTAPIYAGEPGYREGLDGDSDGIACEPYYGH
jgi:hypothetical protein